MPQTKVAVSLEEFWKMAQQADDHLELVDGEVLRMSPSGARHGFVLIALGSILRALVPETDARVFGDIGLLLPSGNVRGPDICLISAERLRAVGMPAGWWPEPVELAIEIIGAEDKAAELDRKTEEYFAAGARQVWRINPETRKVAVYRSPKDVQIFGEEDELTATDLHPALRFPVRKLFE